MNILIYNLLSALFRVLELLIFAHIILSWVRGLNPTLWRIAEAVDQLVNPLFKPFRKIVPTIDLGGIGFDLTPIVVLILLRIVQSIILPVFLTIPF